MEAARVNREDVKRAAKEVGLNMAYEPYCTRGSRFRFRLVPIRDEAYKKEHGHCRYQRRSAGWSHTERKVWACCWHGHREFFRALFKLAPEARIYTALLRRDPSWPKYWSAENFEDNFEVTGMVNIGSAYMPVQAREACFCSETGDDYDNKFEASKMTLDKGQLKKARVKQVPQRDLTGECWLVQIWGLDECDTCEAKDTNECGGKGIRQTGENSKGVKVPVSESHADNVLEGS